MAEENNLDFENAHDRPGVEETLRLLEAGEESGFSSALYYGLSGLDVDQASRFRSVWQNLATGFRRKVIRSLVDAGETNFELVYEPIGRAVLDDEDDDIRALAIELIWDDDLPETMERLIDIAHRDSSVDVRAAAASALGNFILKGELEELPPGSTDAAVEAVIAIWNDQNEEVDVRRRALEAISNSSHPIVEPAIRDAMHSDEPQMRLSAIFAMGRSCDPQWSPYVLEALESTDEAVLYEAARAAGELEITDAITPLKRLAHGDDIEVRDAAIWALGEIGGAEARKALELLSRDAKRLGDEGLMEAIEDALANANLGGDDFFMLKID
jgi:HEAT repeat protein